MEIFIAIYTSYGWYGDPDTSYPMAVSFTLDGAKSLVEKYVALLHREVEWSEAHPDYGKIDTIGEVEIKTGKMDELMV